MALFSDAVRTLADSKHFWVKVFITASVFAFGVSRIFPGHPDINPVSVGIFAVCSAFTAGYIACYTNNMLQERSNILPGFLNPFKFLILGAGLLLTWLPGIIVGYFIFKYTVPFITSFDKPLYSGIIVACIAEIFPLGIMAYQTCAYCEDFNILSAFNLKRLFVSASEYIQAVLLLAFWCILFIAIFTAPFAYVFYKMFGKNMLVLSLGVSFVGLMLLLICLGYYAQIYTESKY